MTLEEHERLEHVPAQLGERYPETFARLSAFFRSRGLQPEEASDLAQETIARTLVHLGRHGAISDDVTPLVFRIGRNLLIERWRSKRDQVPLDAELIVEDESRDPFVAVARDETRRMIDEAIGRLSPRQGVAIRMSMHGHAPREIASRLGIERNAADVLLHRARSRLRVLLASAEALWTAIAVAVFRRRRTAHASERLAPVVPAMLTTVGAGIATVAIALSPSTERPPVPHRMGPAPVTSGGSRPAAATGDAPKAPAVETAGPPAQPSPAVAASVNLRAQRADATVSLPDGDPDAPPVIDVDAWREPGRGVAGSLPDDVPAALCELLESCGVGVSPRSRVLP